ncbi:MAG: chitin disaccharide deacetylase, partial [Armatimonadetes bacterium]|nr:chitin disaccharide deacetylase [Armatimonadota bacterium]
KSILNHLKDGVTEICAHPGFYDSGISKISSYSLMREKELDILTHTEIKKLTGKLGIKLISFKDL